MKKVSLLKNEDSMAKNPYLRNLKNKIYRNDIFEEENQLSILRGNKDLFYSSVYKTPNSEIQKNIRIIKFFGGEENEKSFLFPKEKKIEKSKLIFSPLSTKYYSKKRRSSQIFPDVSNFSSIFVKLKKN